MYEFERESSRNSDLATSILRKEISIMKAFNIFFIFIMFVLFLQSGCKSQQSDSVYKVDSWLKMGSKPNSYEIGKDKSVKYGDEQTYFIKSIADVDSGFGAMAKMIKPEQYLSKRVKFTGYIKTDNLVHWGGMWMRVDGVVAGLSLGFDNMGNRPIKGTTDWTKYEIVLDVPKNSSALYCGVLIEGNGQMWIPDFTLEIVGNDVSVTNMLKDQINISKDYGELPDKLKNIPDGIEIVNTPDLVYASKDEKDTVNYYWIFNTTVKPVKEDLEITEFGSYTWILDHWEFKTVTGEPFTKDNFADWYRCKGGKMKKGNSYKDKHNWYRSSELVEAMSMWYYIGKNEKGEMFKGTSLVECLPILKRSK